MSKSSDNHLDLQEQQLWEDKNFLQTLPEVPMPDNYKGKNKIEKANQLLDFMAECVHSLGIYKNLIDEVDNGMYSSTIFATVEYRETLICNYNNTAILHSQTLDLYIKITTELANSHQFYNPQNKAA